MSNNVFEKDPDAVLDYLFNWANWLQTDETISSANITVSPSGLTVNSSAKSDTAVVVWLSGGTDKTSYFVTCRIVTSENRIEDRTMHIKVKSK